LKGRDEEEGKVQKGRAKEDSVLKGRVEGEVTSERGVIRKMVLLEGESWEEGILGRESIEREGR
jgi:hypothetical protein